MENSAARSLSQRDRLLCAAGMAALLAGVLADASINAGLKNPAAIAEAAARLDELPETIGLWTSTPGTIDERERRIAEIAGAVRREYRHRHTGYTVNLTVLSGAAGPMSVHPPTACFEGVGYTLKSGPDVVTQVDGHGESVTLNCASFVQPRTDFQETVRVFWGWSTDGHWDAPSNPRLTYRGEQTLYKLYITDNSEDSAQVIPQAESFLKEALPVLRDVMKRK